MPVPSPQASGIMEDFSLSSIVVILPMGVLWFSLGMAMVCHVREYVFPQMLVW